jgi:uncharacterized glyoxalase superfamily protein PhnB
VHPVLAARDVAASVEFYRRLGFQLEFQDSPTEPKYAAIRRDDVVLHLQWHAAAEWDVPGDRPTYRFVVDDVDALFLEFQAAGATRDATPVRDTPWGTREFHLRDLDVNGLQFYCAQTAS